jgi:hypothetical protein
MRSNIASITRCHLPSTSVSTPPRNHVFFFHMFRFSKKSVFLSVAAAGRIRATGQPAEHVHSCSEEETQISGGVRWGREGMPHHSQCCQPCAARHLARRQPHNPTRCHILCNGSRSANSYRLYWTLLQGMARFQILDGGDGVQIGRKAVNKPSGQPTRGGLRTWVWVWGLVTLNCTKTCLFRNYIKNFGLWRFPL